MHPDSAPGSSCKSSDLVATGALGVKLIVTRWLDEWDRTPSHGPFFIFINYLEAPLSHNPPEPFRGRFLARPPSALVQALNSPE